MLETEMKSKLKDFFQFLPVKIVDIETGGTEVGIADLAIRTDQVDIWMESKKIDRWPSREGTMIRPKYRPGQYKFLKEHQALGGIALLAITFEDMWFIVKEIKKEYTQNDLAYHSIVPMDLLDQRPEFILKILNNLGK